jgi:hypothetical protein
MFNLIVNTNNYKINTANKVKYNHNILMTLPQMLN